MLSDKEIKHQLHSGNIVIDPFIEKNLGTNSYDVTLGPWYFEQDPNVKVVDLRSQHDISKFWGEPIECHDDIPIESGQTILCHTNEVVGGRNGYLASMKSRSSTARYGLSVCRCAGVGDVGYISRWTMEISNHTKATIWMPVGMRIAQFIFNYVGETDKEYTGQYGDSSSAFDPLCMLPKAVKL